MKLIGSKLITAPASDETGICHIVHRVQVCTWQQGQQQSLKTDLEIATKSKVLFKIFCNSPLYMLSSNTGWDWAGR
jgi:hypothetical protein